MENKNFMITLFFILFIISTLNIALDYSLSNKAMQEGGYYESNIFTQNNGLYLHMIILIMTMFIFMCFFVFTEKLELGILFYLLFNVIWIINNIISIYYLYVR